LIAVHLPEAAGRETGDAGANYDDGLGHRTSRGRSVREGASRDATEFGIR
jgi:hypothetical protein